MQSCLSIAKRWVRLRGPLLAALACAPLGGCVGEIKKGIDPDATVSEPGPAEADDGAVLPNTPGNPRTDATVGTQDGSRPVSPNDARVPDLPVDNDEPDASTPGGGKPDAMVVDPGMPTNPTKRTPLFVVVGYSGVRQVSRDLGKTWSNLVVSDSSGANADDEHLLRSVRFGSGKVLVAVGWKIWTSTDGVTWTERNNPAGQWQGGLQFANNLFVGAGGSGTSIYSSDGLSWMAGNSRNGEPARTVAYGDNKFVAATDPKNWWQTTNGKDWTVLSGGHATDKAVWCKDKFTEAKDCTEPLARNLGRTAFGEGVYVSAAGGKIERSENGVDWTSVKDTGQYPVTDVAFGYLDGI